MIRVWGLDPGFAHLGLANCVIDLNAKVEWCVPEELELLETFGSEKARHIAKPLDNFRRAQEIAAFLARSDPPDLICMESMSFTPSASSSAKLSMAMGVVAAFAYHHHLAVLQVTPTQIKVALNCKPQPRPKLKKGEKRPHTDSVADKLLVQEALTHRYGAQLATLLSGIKPSNWEHPLDALGAVIACRETNEMRLLAGLKRSEVLAQEHHDVGVQEV